ncbi:3-coathanger stack domain-containing protein [Lacihabitans sp. LS3-19]|uniref:3-coathanger stack domain-containing protein n=1 Tax=Lacihabitans sp. LS3-19 TaxID=2487335 RepID=UPI0020CE49C1|nr:3-coathanger stack domain-containing protein [Lacihabitans sp. LS3-19]
MSFEISSKVETSKTKNAFLLPPKPVLSSSNYLVCNQGSSIVLTVGNCTGTVNWNLVGGNFSNYAYLTGTYTANATIVSTNKYFVSCTVSGETSPNSDTITVDYKKVRILPQDNLLCIGGSLELVSEALPSTDITSYQWYFNYSLDNAQVSSSYLANSSGSVYVTVTYDDGCVANSPSFQIVSSGVLNSPSIVALQDGPNGLPRKIFDKRFGGNGYENVQDIVQTDNKGIILAGTITNGSTGFDISQSGRGQFDYWLVKTDSLGNKVWDKRFGGNYQNTLNQVRQTSNGDILAFGVSNSNISHDKTVGVIIDPYSGPVNDIWVIKTDSEGNKLWDKKFGGDDYDAVSKVLSLPNNEFLIAGQTRSGISGTVSQSSRGGYDFWICKIDSAGNQLWDKRYGGSGNDNCKNIVKTQDGGFILAGNSSSPQSGDKSQNTIGYQDIWVIKIDENGAKIWDKSFYDQDYPNLIDLTSVVVDNNNDIVLGGYSQGNGTKLIKIDESGNIIWTKSFQNLNSSSGLIPNNKGILLLGSQQNNTSSVFLNSISGSSDGYIVQLDSLGNLIWSKLLGGGSSDGFNAFIQQGTDTIILGGGSDSNFSGDKSQPTRGSADYWLMKVKIKELMSSPVGISPSQNIELVVDNCAGNVTWSGAISGIGHSISVIPIPPATYTADCSAFGCNTNSSILIQQNCSDNFEVVIKNELGQIILDPKICDGSTLFTLEASNCLGSISWSTGQTGSSISVSPISSTFYTATCSGTSCAPVNIIKQILAFESPIINLIGNATFCEGDSVIISAITTSIGYEFLWYKDDSPIVPSITSSVLTAKTSGSYNVKISKSGCSSFAISPIILTSNALPNAPTFNSYEEFTCDGVPATLTAMGCAGAISWPGNESQFGSNEMAYVYLNWSTPDRYIKSACTVNGCKSLESTVKVSIGSNSLGENTRYLCNGLSITLTSSELGNGTFKWYKNNVLISGSNISTLTVNQPGIYKSEITLGNTCVFESSVIEVINTDTLNIPMVNYIDTASIHKEYLLKIWDKTLGGNGSSYSNKIIKTSDNYFLIIGTTFVNANGNLATVNKGLSDILITKIDSLGNIIWEKQFGTSWYDEGYSAELTSDGGILILGTSFNLNDGDKTANSLGFRDFWVIKIDNSGNKIWDKVYGTPDDEDFPVLLKTADGNFIIGGVQKPYNSSTISKYKIYKIDEIGNVLWDKTFTGGGVDNIKSIINTIDGGYLIGGISRNPIIGFDRTDPSQGQSDVWLIKTDVDGNVHWDKSYGGNGYEGNVIIKQDIDSSYYFVSTSTSGISGHKTKSNYGQNDFWVVKLDSLGGFLWDQNYGGSDNEILGSFALISKNHILIGGGTSSPVSNDIIEEPFGLPGYFNPDVLIMDINTENGIVEFQKRIGGTDYENLNDIFLENNNIYFTGSSSSLKNVGKNANSYSPGSDFWFGKIIKTKPVNDSLKIEVLLGQSVKIFATDCPGQVTWSNSSNGDFISVSPTENTTYSVSCDYSNCTVTNSVLVKVITCGINVALTNLDDVNSGSSANPSIFRAYNKIQAKNQIGSNGQNGSAKFVVGKSIVLEPGFKVEKGSGFQTKLSSDPCNE